MKKQIFTLTLFLFCLSAQAQSVKLVDFADQYNWLIGMAHAGDDRIFAVQKSGIIIVTDKDGNQMQPAFLDISNKVNNSFQNEKGLLGLAFHPDYENNRRFFVFYNNLPEGDIVISEFETDPGDANRAMVNSEKVLLSFPHPRGNHTGGTIKFGHDGYLYFGVGDGGGSGDPDKTGQDLTSYLGKIHRIDVDNGAPYSIPDDNPFVDDASAKKETYAWGLRNPWRISFDRLTGDLWIADVGQNDKEEVNFQKAGTPGGQNYGWSCREASNIFTQSECSPGANYIDPAFEYAHIGGSCSGSVSGGVVYRGMQFGDLWGKYLVTDFCTGAIYVVENTDGNITGKKIADFANSEYTALEENNLGELFMTAFFSNKIVKIESNNAAPTAQVLTGDITICQGESAILTAYNIPGSSMDLLWQLDGQDFLPAMNAQLSTTQPGSYRVKVTNPNNGMVSFSDPVIVTVRQPSVSDQNITAMPGDEIADVIIQSDTSFSRLYADQFGCDSTVNYIVSVVSRTQDVVSEIGTLNIFPNPVQNTLNIDFHLIKETALKFSIKNSQGKLIDSFSGKEKMKSGKHQISKDISQLTPGLYFLTATTNRGILVRKVLKI